VTNKKSAESAAEMEPVLMHAVVQSKAKTAEATAETRAAKSLNVQLVGVVRSLPLARTWRVQLPEGGQGALVVLGDNATSADRALFARAAEQLHAAGEIEGVLPVRGVAASHDAFLTDLIVTGNAGDLPALAWPLRRQLEFVLRVLRSLDSLHQVGMVHGCLCAANVLLDDDLNPVLSESGAVAVAALASRGAGDPYLGFASPEIQRGDEPDARADVYAAGRLLQEVTKASAPPRTIADVVAKCTAPEPGVRYGTAKELVAAVQKALDDLPREEPAPVLPRPPTPGPIEPRAPAKRERRARPDAPQNAFATKTPGRPEARWTPPVWVGVAGVVLVAASFAAASILGGSNDLLRPLLLVAAPLGVALATTLLPALPRRAGLGRLALALGAAALVYLLDPLSLAYRIAAQARMRGDEASRRAAIAEVMRLGRDFRGLSFSGAGLSGVDLTAADLRRVSFAGADLTGAHLYAAEIYGTSFANAQLAGADLQGTQLQLADTSGARCDDTTKLPPSWRCDGGHLDRATAP
jgi:hypothetical protein